MVSFTPRPLYPQGKSSWYPLDRRLGGPQSCYLDLITLTKYSEEYELWISSLHKFLHTPATCSILGPNILLSTLISNTFNLCSSFNVTDQVSRQYKTAGKIIVLYFLVFTFIGRRAFELNGRKNSEHVI
jgi:hypothetical protein